MELVDLVVDRILGYVNVGFLFFMVFFRFFWDSEFDGTSMVKGV